MTSCSLCGDQTSGSTGAAGIRWPSICQRCKDAEDEAIDRRLFLQSPEVFRKYYVPPEGDLCYDEEYLYGIDD